VNNELIIDVSTNEISIALLESKRLVELQKEKKDLEFAVGDIYLGTVKKIMPGLNAAFVDVGYEKDAFLHYHDLGPQILTLNKYIETVLNKKGKIPSFQKFKRLPNIDKNGKIADVLRSGQKILVQIAKEPISTKGPRLTSEISIAGRNIVLMPLADKVSVSQRIESRDEKSRLKTLLQSIKPKNYGIIVRTVAESKKVALLDTELRGLMKKWENAFERLRGAKPPQLILGELDRTTAFLRDILKDTFSRVHVNDENIFNDIRSYISEIAPEQKNIVKLYKSKTPIFEQFGINKQIKASFGDTVSVKNGAYLIIEHTEALHVIDVNSGNRSKSGADQESNALDVNSVAAEEIARQLRLRDMGGIIVVDFIDMHDNSHKQMVYEKMKQAMESDRTKHNILPLSKFGLMQITRQRVRPEMHINTKEKCPSCGGSGEISASIVFTDTVEESIAYAVEKYRLKYIHLKLHPYVAAYLTKGLYSLRRRWKASYHCRIKVTPLSSLQFLEYHMYTKDGEEIITE
jgi:ribonuclease G